MPKDWQMVPVGKQDHVIKVRHVGLGTCLAKSEATDFHWSCLKSRHSTYFRHWGGDHAWLLATESSCFGLPLSQFYQVYSRLQVGALNGRARCSGRTFFGSVFYPGSVFVFENALRSGVANTIYRSGRDGSDFSQSSQTAMLRRLSTHMASHHAILLVLTIHGWNPAAVDFLSSTQVQQDSALQSDQAQNGTENYTSFTNPKWSVSGNGFWWIL